MTNAVTTTRPPVTNDAEVQLRAESLIDELVRVAHAPELPWGAQEHLDADCDPVTSWLYDVINTWVPCWHPDGGRAVIAAVLADPRWLATAADVLGRFGPRADFDAELRAGAGLAD